MPRANRSKNFQRQVAFAICLLFCGVAQLPVAAQNKTYRPPPQYVQFGKPDQAEGARILQDFRQRALPAGLYLEFQLRVLPRRGDAWTVPARLWAGRNDKGPIWRMEMLPETPSKQCRLLVQNGPENALWKWTPASKTDVSMPLDSLFEALAGTDVTAFDLQMPFLYWTDFVYEGLARVRGRPAHVFLMYPPAELREKRPVLCGVRVYLDTQFNALVQSEQIGPGDAVLKSVTILDLKKVGEQWLPKTIDVRDDESRNKTRFSVTRAAVSLDLVPSLFSPESLDKAVDAPAGNLLRDMGP